MRLPLLALLIGGCVPEAVPVRTDRLIVNADTVWHVDVDAKLPTDVVATPYGGFVVLDGYQTRAQVYDASHALLTTVDTTSWGRPVRLAVAERGGWWLADPGAHAIRHIATDDAVDLEFFLPAREDGTPLEPLCVTETADGSLRVGVRSGGVVALNAETGAITDQAYEDIDGVPLGAITDVVSLANGELLAVDPIKNRVQRFDGFTPTGATGRFGMWIGYLLEPKGATATPNNGVMVVDSALDVAQIFMPDPGRGPAVGVGAIAHDGELLRFDHPIAVERSLVNPDEYMVLDSTTHTVWGFTISEDELARATAASSKRALREPLISQTDEQMGVDSDTCYQCHDCLVNDSRFGWDPDRFQHPVNIVPERDLPAFFPLDDDGKMRCTTCHSPHGSVSVEDAASVEDGGSAHDLVRHRQSGETFTRLTRGDSSLCIACHGDDPHDSTTVGGDGDGRGHLSGGALLQALKERASDEDLSNQGGCLACHAVHGAVDETLARADDDGESCAACHPDKLDEDRGHAVNPAMTLTSPRPSEGAEIPVGHGGSVTCRSCHDLVGGGSPGLLRAPADGDVLCVACHNDQGAVLSSSHRRVRGAIPCLGCHDIHEGPSDRKLVTATPSADDPSGCLSCHGPGHRNPHGARPGERGHPVGGDTRHDGALVTCDSCHDAHAPRPGAKASCERCHTAQAAAASRGGHGRAGCRDCHPAHRNTPRASGVAADMNPRAKRCLACHGAGASGDAPRVTQFVHPAPVFKPDGTRWTPLGGLPLFAPDGSPQPEGTNGDLTCSTCHETHGPDATHPGDKLRRPGWRDACSACHADDALILYRYFHQPARRAGVGGVR